MEIKYIIHNGCVRGKNEQLRFVTSWDVVRLYGVPRMNCIFASDPMRMRGLREGDDVLHVHLHPDSTGEYNLEKELKRETFRRKSYGKYEYNH